MKNILTIGSSIEELEDVSIWIQNCIPCEVIEKTRNAVLLIAQELITNAIIYGNKSIESKTVKINIVSNEDYIVMSIEDEGKGLPSLPTKEEAQKMDYLGESGRGMKLTVLLSEEATIEKNKIIVKFKI